MRNAQVIKLSQPHNDMVMAFDGYNVINKTTYNPINTIEDEAPVTAIPVTVKLMDITDNTTHSVDLDLNYNQSIDYWYILIADLILGIDLDDGHKYVGAVIEVGETYNMQTFKIDEFCVDDEGFEDTWMRLPYQIEFEDNVAFIRWYAYNDDDFSGSPLYEAPAYQGGSGLIPATSAANITHRGAIVKTEL